MNTKNTQDKVREMELKKAETLAKINRVRQRKLMKEYPCSHCFREPSVAHSPEFGFIGASCLNKRIVEVGRG